MFVFYLHARILKKSCIIKKIYVTYVLERFSQKFVMQLLRLSMSIFHTAFSSERCSVRNENNSYISYIRRFFLIISSIGCFRILNFHDVIQKLWSNYKKKTLHLNRIIQFTSKSNVILYQPTIKYLEFFEAKLKGVYKNYIA